MEQKRIQRFYELFDVARESGELEEIQKALLRKEIKAGDVISAKKSFRSKGDEEAVELTKKILEFCADNYLLPNNNMRNEVSQTDYLKSFVATIQKDYAKCLTNIPFQYETYCWVATWWQELEKIMQKIYNLDSERKSNPKTPGLLFNVFFDAQIFPFHEAKRLEYIVFTYLNWAKHEYNTMISYGDNTQDSTCKITGMALPVLAHERGLMKLVIARHCLADANDFCENYYDKMQGKGHLTMRPNIIENK